MCRVSELLRDVPRTLQQHLQQGPSLFLPHLLLSGSFSHRAQRIFSVLGCLLQTQGQMWTRFTSEKLFLPQSSCLQLLVCKARAVTCFGQTSRASGMFRGADWQKQAAPAHGETTLPVGKAWKQLGMEELSLARREPGKCCQGARVREAQRSRRVSPRFLQRARAAGH